MSDLAAPASSTTAPERYIDDVIAAANAMKQGDTLRMRGTTWVAAAERWLRSRTIRAPAQLPERFSVPNSSHLRGAGTARITGGIHLS
jgi:hypothetical protein